MDLPTPHALAAMALAVAMFYAFASGRLRIEIISLSTITAIALGLFFFPLPGTGPKDGLALAFEGFGHHALVTICALMILGRGLVVTGALDPAARALSRVWRWNRQIGLLVTLTLAIGMSMLINDTPVLVLMIPILAQLALKGGMPASKTLIPVNAAILIGGMSTAIGTSTNLLVVSIAGDLGMEPIGIFHFTPIVLTAALVALPYMWLVMPRLLPDNSSAVSQEARDFLALLRLDPSSSAVGMTMDKAVQALPAEVTLQPNGFSAASEGVRLSVEGRHDALEDAARKLDASLAPGWLIARIKEESARLGEDIVVAEMLVAPDSRLIGRTLQWAGLEEIAVIGVHQARRPIGETRRRSADAPLAEGDVLLVMGLPDHLRNFSRDDGVLMLEGGQEVARTAKAPLALAIMLGAVGLASIGAVPIAISALGGAILMFVTGCVKFDRVGRALSAKVVVLVASSIALGKFILVSGAAEWLGGLLASGLQDFPASVVLAAIMLFVTLLTNFASNTAAAAVGTPIAFDLATKLGLPPEPMVLAVLFGCNLCYATPIAYQTNMMIMVEGDYKFRDYIKSGVPLVVLMTISLSILLVLNYDL
jgi:di/tricarboxylate transporter